LMKQAQGDKTLEKSIAFKAIETAEEIKRAHMN